ncbi:MAG: CPBP family intramembrane glutamic endopeptidase [Ferruginibacter sp.]
MNDLTSSKRKLWVLICCYLTFNMSASLLFSPIPSDTSFQLSKLSLSLYSVVSFLLPSFIIRKLFWSDRLLNDCGSKHHWNVSVIVFAILAMLCTIVVMNWLGHINQQLPIWSSVKEAEIKSQEILQLYMKMDSIELLFYNLIIFSFVPSFCEEVFFRGTMQPLWVKSTGSKFIAVLITATIFSFLHFQLLGFLPRLFGGLVLGTIFLLSKNIALTIICHFIYNSSIVVLNYTEQHSTLDMSVFQRQLLNPYLILSASVLTTTLLLQLHKTTRRLERIACREEIRVKQ